MGCISPPPPQNRYQSPPPVQSQSHQQAPVSQDYHQSVRYPLNPPSKTPVPNRPHSVRRGKTQCVQATYNEWDMMRRYGVAFRKNMAHMVDVKVPTSAEKIQFTISKQPLILLPVETGNYPVQIIKNLCFQQKMTWMRIQVQKMRISWQTGCEWLNVDRHDVVMSSFHTLQTMNLRKQLKIRLSGQQVDDAGGVLREWMHLCVKDIFNSSIADLFRMCKTDETAYRFIIEHGKTQAQEQYRLDVAYLLGIVIGKALFDRIPLDCFLTRSLWRQVCGQEVQFCDFYSYDKEMFQNLKVILQTPNAQDLSLSFTYFVGDQAGKEQEVILKPNGRSITVNDSNKQEYVNCFINYLCIKSCHRYVKKMKEAINKIIPLQILSIFEPHEIEMLLNGPPHINVQDWKNSTLYINYQPHHPQIQWFWAYVERLDQEKLGNLLHFVTGSRRVPILGFSYLQSNRNKINKFTIQRCSIEQHNAYPKGHTCFNRLQLPAYRSQQELNMRMDQILQNQINSFGLS